MGHSIQDLQDVLPLIGLNVPAGHAKHNDSPVKSLYLPIGQAKHVVFEALPVAEL